MLVWFALLLPAITTLIIHHFWKHKVVVWELALPFLVSIVLVGICHLVIQMSLTTDTEYWGGLVVKAEYYERWDERVSCTHTKYCTSTDGRGNTSTYACGTHHIYDVTEHPPRWQVVNTNGHVIQISANKYRELVRKFGNSRFVNLRRNYHTVDGDKYVAEWNQSRETAEVTVTAHLYENRVKSSRSVFNYEEVSPEDIEKYGLYGYPSIRSFYRLPPVLGDGVSGEEQRAFELLNGYLGSRKEVRVWVLLFEDQPREAGHYQEALWVGGHKNEFVITIGLKEDRSVDWAHVFSWSESEHLKVGTRHHLETMGTLNLISLATWLEPELRNRYRRKSFEEFSYLSVEPPWWATLLVFILTVLANVGISWYVIANEFEERGW